MTVIDICIRWGQIYILDALLRYVPERNTDAELMGERIVAQLSHANSAVVLTAIKALLYLMNYMENRKLIDYICKKMGPPLGMYLLLFLSLIRCLPRFQSQFCLPGRKFSMSR